MTGEKEAYVGGSPVAFCDSYVEAEEASSREDMGRSRCDSHGDSWRTRKVLLSAAASDRKTDKVPTRGLGHVRDPPNGVLPCLLRVVCDGRRDSNWCS